MIIAFGSSESRSIPKTREDWPIAASGLKGSKIPRMKELGLQDIQDQRKASRFVNHSCRSPTTKHKPCNFGC